MSHPGIPFPHHYPQGPGCKGHSHRNGAHCGLHALPGSDYCGYHQADAVIQAVKAKREAPCSPSS